MNQLKSDNESSRKQTTHDRRRTWRSHCARLDDEEYERLKAPAGNNRSLEAEPGRSWYWPPSRSIWRLPGQRPIRCVGGSRAARTAKRRHARRETLTVSAPPASGPSVCRDSRHARAVGKSRQVPSGVKRGLPHAIIVLESSGDRSPVGKCDRHSFR